MKLSLVTASIGIAALSFACGTSAEDNKQSVPKVDPPAPLPGNTSAPPRQLVEGSALPTSSVNLLADPGFSLVGSQGAGYGAFLGFYDTTSAQFSLETMLDSRSPAGFAGEIALVRPNKATNDKSASVTLLTSFLGGKGPFHGRIWLSKSNVDDTPVEFPTDGSVTVSITDSPESIGASAFDLQIDPAATMTVAGRTWVLLRGDVTRPIERGGFFMVHTGTTGGHVEIAAPAVTTDEIAVGQSVLSHRTTLLTAQRPLTSFERAAIRGYTAIPPRLVPASSNVKATRVESSGPLRRALR